MNALLRQPKRYLAVHWTVTVVLAVTLLFPSIATLPGRGISHAHTLTLITGQVVPIMQGSALATVPGVRESRYFGSDLYAIPTALNPGLLRAPGESGGALDAQLFDVSYQAANGLDDASADRIPVIVQFQDFASAHAALAGGLVDGGIHLTSIFEYVPDALGYVSKHGPFVPAGAPLSAGITAIYLDGLVQDIPDASPDGGQPATAGTAGPLLNDALPMIGIDAARKLGLTGKGVKIAIVDTGIDSSHPDLKGRVIAAHDFSSDGTPEDQMGHGTHVAGIAAGTGALSDGKYGGVAPQASLINAKALSKNGSGSIGAIMQAMEWAADQGAQIVNLSLGGGPSDGSDPLSQLVNAITAKKNVLFVIAAGNSGPRGKVSTPAAADSALAVAAIDKERQMAPFSSQGPRLGDMAVKPEIAAPGVRITAPRANYGDNEPYVTYSGTSMATPMVAGAAALVKQLHPDWSAMQLKDALMNGASPIGSASQYVSVYAQGSGVVDLANMVDQKLLIRPGALSFGVVAKNAEVVKTLTLQNLSNEEITFELAGDLQKIQQNGQPSLQPSAADVTIPAGQSINISLRLRAGAASGTYSGDIQAEQSGKTLAHAAVGVTVK